MPPQGYPPQQYGQQPPFQQAPFQQQPPYGQPPFQQGPPPPPGGGNRKVLLIGGAGLAVILVIGLVLALASGSDDKKPISLKTSLPPVTLPSDLTDPSASATTPPPPGQTYTKIINPCPLVNKATVAKLVPFTEKDTFDSKNGLAVDNAFSSCHWESKFQPGAANQVIRDLRTKVVLRAADKYHDALTNAADDFADAKDTADEQANKTNFLGNPYGPVTAQPGLGDEAISQPFVNAKLRLQESEVHVRLGNMLVTVTYYGSSHPKKNFLDSTKDKALPEPTVTKGAIDVATQVVAGLKGCTACSTGPAASAPPSDAPTVVSQVKPVWANGTLAGLVDPCALPKKTTLDRLIPGFDVRRNADAGYTSGKDRSTATCYWEAPSSNNNQLRKIQITLTYLAARNGATAAENGKGEYGRRVKQVDKDADKTNFLGEVYGSKEVLVNVGDDAYAIPITGKERSRAEMSVLIGNVVMDLQYGGADLGKDLKFTPIDTGTAVAELKTIATEAVATLRP